MGIPEELFQIISSDGRRTLVAAGRVDRNVRLYACTCGVWAPAATVSPTEARDIAAELIRLADEVETET